MRESDGLMIIACNTDDVRQMRSTVSSVMSEDTNNGVGRAHLGCMCVLCSFCCGISSSDVLFEPLGTA